ncbi:PKD domain-containing protein [Candidatus Bipolaricaulota bacterium]
MGRRTLAIIVVTVALALASAGVALPQSAANAQPVALFRAHAVQTGAGSTVLLDATDSEDPDGRIVAYQWVFGDGTTGSGAILAHTYPRRGIYIVILLVTDDDGESHMATEMIDVSRLPIEDAKAPSETSIPPELVERSPADATGVGGYGVGDQAPSFSLPDFDGEIVSLMDLEGQVVLLEFFFSSCSGCLSSIPLLESLGEQFGDEGLVVVVVVLDRDPAYARDLFSDGGYENLIVLRESDPARPTRAAYGVSNVPHVFLIDRSGVIRFTGHPGGLTGDLVTTWL